MLKFICLFFPAAFSLLIIETLRKKPFDFKKNLLLYLSNIIFINMACLFVKKFILNTADAPLANIGADMIPTVALNYLIMALPFAVIIAVVEALLKRCVKIEVEGKEQNENQEENKN